ncbi:MAG: NAD(P)(+) transhydrogenase (Re/Si-specific) subunit beta [Planctomycetes bacterium]|nr:NAD(P)(+) transhydrogenase (Re/Si-specific) subunit beta [Planctomycetota bacterium]
MEESTVKIIQNAAYLLASILFIRGLKGLTHPRTAVRGNLMGAVAMLIAIVATLWGGGIMSWTWIFAGLIVGTAAGAYLALTVEMTGMPQMVGLFNGFGGAASFLVAGGELIMSINRSHAAQDAAAAATQTAGHGGLQFMIAVALSGIIGSVTLFGSVVAAGKLKEMTFTFRGKKYWMSNALFLPGRHFINGALFVLTMILCVLIVKNPDTVMWYAILVVVAGALGILITIPIGGADMPVIIALLNSYSGLAACATGFVINNNVLIIAGSLVGASGLILTKIMCKAMNRSLANVMFARLGPSADGPSADEIYEGKIKSTSAEEVAMLFDGAQRVVIVPGYGMAVSQAQHAVRDLANLLESRGINVDFAIHPVAGRMPGHMNVLLAEADIPYDKLREMDDINPELAQVDVALVLGANDVVNPVARTDPSSPIAGMPIIDVDKCRTVVVIKRSLSPGFAGIPNPLFAMDHTLMFFSDGKKAFVELVAAVKES